MLKFHQCPRCGGRSLERLTSYAHCPACLYFEDYWKSPESDYIEALKTIEEIDAAKKSKPSEVVPLRKKKDGHNQPQQIGA